LRVELENDANAAAYGEYKIGAGRGSRDLFYITIGEGIGGAIIVDGKLWTGASGFAGEVGHITIDTEGSECQCGNTGCLETVASAPNIVRRANERLNRDSTSSLSKLAINKNFTADDMAREAMEGDDFALMMIERTGKYIGTGVASVINLLNIERIVLGGGVMQAGDLILKPIIEEARKRAFQPCFEATEIVFAALGTDAATIGVAMLARDASVV
jgi:glucokinase